MRIYQLVVDTYEPGHEYPIVTHIFRGRDREQTLGFYNAHLRADAFLRECEKGLYAGKVRCRNRKISEGWVEFD